MRRFLPFAVAFVLLASSGVVHGLLTGRWGISPDVRAAAARCDQLPMSFGEWESHVKDISPAELEVAEVVGYCSREYVKRGDQKQRVTLLLICGRPGPISVHTPDICYAGAGYSVVGNVEHYPIKSDAVAAEFATACFSKPNPVPVPLRILWSWSDGGPWSAPDNPRLTFARSGALYKLYVLRGTDQTLQKDDPCVEFLEALLPELQKCLSKTP
jgi:hypothetical protein